MQFQRALLSFGVVLICSMPALAAGRSEWRHDSGNFQNTVGIQWVEKSPDGTFYFREVHRSDGAVDLYDRTRDCTVRLTANSCYVKFGEGGFERFYYGGWRR